MQTSHTHSKIQYKLQNKLSRLMNKHLLSGCSITLQFCLILLFYDDMSSADAI